MAATKFSNRLLVICLDAADFDLVRLWANDGSMPILGAFLNTGLWGSLNTITEISHTAVWPSLFTATNPAKHGIYNFFQTSPRSYEIGRVNAKQCAQIPFWKYLDERGKKCIVIDAPFDRPIEGFHGIQIFEWGSWVRYTERGSNPEAVWNRLLERYGVPPIENEATAQWDKIEELSRLQNWLIEGVDKKGRAVTWIMETQKWDLIVAVFPETHPAGHFFWHLHDENYGADSEKIKKKLGTYLKDVYQAVDRAIGRIIDHLSENDTILIVSGDRIGPNYSGWHLLPEVLKRLGFMLSKRGDFHAVSGGGVSNHDDFLKRIRNSIPHSLRKKVSQILPENLRFRLWRRLTHIDLDWSNTKVFCVPNDSQGHLRINVRGREPLGCVDPGNEYDELCKAIKEQLEELVNPFNGKRAVKNVIRTDLLFLGKLVDHLPDLVVVWDDDSGLSTQLYSERVGTVESRWPAYALPPFYVGNHRGPGFIILKGPGIGRGRLEENNHIYDIAPTILSFFGHPIPPEMEGKVLGIRHDDTELEGKAHGSY